MGTALENRYRLHAFVLILAVLFLAAGAGGNYGRASSLPPPPSQPQHDLIIKNGHVIDPRNRIDGPMDVAVSGNKIAEVARTIDAARGRRIADATGLYVVPGLID